MHFTNLTPQEQFRFNGCLTIETQEMLIDAADRLDAIEGIDAHLSEAKASYPYEDFMVDILASLRSFSKSIDSKTPINAIREAIVCLIEDVETLQDEVNQSSDYGRDELRQALKALED